MINIHLLINLVIIAIGIYIAIGNRKLKKKIGRNQPLEYVELLVKLKHILDTSEYEIFKIAAKEKGWQESRVDADFSRYMDSNATVLPVYLTDFLEDGRETIMEIKIVRWVI